METTWSREQVQALVDEGGFYYQNIDLPYGLSTGGTDRSPTARAIFPEDMAGKTVLDLGCKFGFFCFEALKRGAKRAVGVDVDPFSLERARRVAACLGLPATFEQFDIEKEPIHERFDYVLCLNLLHHMRNPLTVLERLAAVTDERLILESATMGRHDRRRLRLSLFETLLLRRRPILYASRNGTSDKRNVQKFFVTPSALENLLRYQGNAFARVDEQPSDHKNRYISVAHRRRVGELVVVGGITGSGCAELAGQLARGQAPEVAALAETGDGSGWVHVDANDLAEFSEPDVPRLILHYDILRPHRRSAKTHARDEVMDLLRCARRVTFVTLWRPPDQLRRRFEAHPVSLSMRAGWFFEGRRRRKLLREFADPQEIGGHYRRWFDFAAATGARHFVVSPDAEPRLASLEEWQRSQGTATSPVRSKPAGGRSSTS